jgi:hypothetical protein
MAPLTDSVQIGHVPVPTEDIRAINQELDRQASLGAASEQVLVSLFQRLTEPGFDQKPDSWPTLARLAELTLYSAGCLALAGEFAACGDLLFNPDGKLLHIKGSSQPLAIKRHRAVTRQVAHLVPPGWRTIEWLKQRTFLELPQKALLPCLRDSLRAWHRSGDYLKQLDKETEEVASSIVLLAGLEAATPAGLPEGLDRLSRPDRVWLEARLYRPSLRRFYELGRAIANGDCGG